MLLRGGRPPIEALLASGALVAIGSDANAGTFGEPSMPLAIGLAVMLGFSDRGRALGRDRGCGTLAGAGAIASAASRSAWRPTSWPGTSEHEGAFVMRPGAVAPVAMWIAGERGEDRGA